MKPSLHWLLIFIPITLVLDELRESSQMLFFSAALALIPIAGLIVKATEQIAMRTTDSAGGLLNATFGNAPELIIGMVALRAGLLQMVRASLIGAILANLLLTLGLSFFLGGIRHHIQRFNPAAARTYSTMMLLASVSMGIPSSFSRYFAPGAFIREERLLNVGIAVMLLFAYGLYLWFSLGTHAGEFASAESESGEDAWQDVEPGPRGCNPGGGLRARRMDERDLGGCRRWCRQSARDVIHIHRNRFARHCGRGG
jgi:Ca2+:H+ antiporter